MTLSHEQFRERLVDYLYGELDGEARAEFEACLAESEPYRRELEALRDTLQLARAGLSELEDAAPSRVKRAVLDAAREAAPLRAQAQPPLAAAKPGFFAWLRNPGLVAVAGFATLALLALLNRDSLVAPPQDYAVPANDSPSAAHETREPASETEPAAPSASAADEPRASVGSGAAPGRRGSGPSASGAARRRAEPVSTDNRARRRASADAARRESRADKTTSDDALGYRLGDSQPLAAEPGPAEAAAPQREYAEPPPPRAAPAAPAPARLERLDAAASTRPYAEPPRDRFGSSSPQSEEKASPAPVETAPAPAAAPAAATARKSAGVAAPAGGAPDDLTRLSLDALLQRARSQLAQDRPLEAARAYRELLRRFPRDLRAADWRRQLDSAQRAATPAR